MRRAIVAVVALAGLSCAQNQSMDHHRIGAAHQMLRPDQIKFEPGPPGLPPGSKIAVLEGDPSKPGLFIIRGWFPAGYRIPPHTHPTAELVTVISGTLHLGMGPTFDESKGTSLPPGGYASLPAGMQHYAWSEGETIVQISGKGPFQIIYVNPADDPRRK